MRTAATEIDREKLRAALFGHIAGLVLVPTIDCLWQWGVLHYFTNGQGWVSLDEIVRSTRGKRGYLRVAMRLLTTCGWMHEKHCATRGPLYAITAQGKVALRIAPALYSESNCMLQCGIHLDDLLSSDVDDASFAAVEKYVQGARRNWFASPSARATEAEVFDQVRGHLDGLLAGPAVVLLARRGIFTELAHGPVEIERLGGLAHRWETVLSFLELLGWTRMHAGSVEFTPAGHHVAQIAASYGIPVSYLPLYQQLDRLLFASPAEEPLVDRSMNAWGSGGLHKTYFFEQMDEIVIDLFNRPLDRQPAGICDMGCGDGTLLKHLHQVIATRTSRGKALDTHPLYFIGADSSEGSRRACAHNLEALGVPKFHVIHGDIANPDQMAIEMIALGLDVRDFLHVRSFLDHNRSYRAPMGFAPGMRTARSAGAFAQRGAEISADFLEENLVRHLRSWVPYCERFGLLLLEQHTLPPEITAANLDKTPTVAYDGFHGYSDQYLVELAVFQECLREAGFQPEPRYQSKFPKSELATVSINLLVGAAA